MSKKALLALSITLGLLTSLLHQNLSHAQTRVQIFKRGETHLTVRTQEGMERLVLTETSIVPGSVEERHYRGHARPRGGKTEMRPVALTTTGDTGLLFFTSRRTGRPVAVKFSLRKNTSTRTRVHRVPQSSLACGSAAHDDEPTTTARALTGRRRRMIAQPAMAGAFNPPRVIELATEADYDFYRIHGRDSNSFIRSVINATDALYTSSLGIRLKIVSQRVASKGASAPQPINAEDLLAQFSSATASQTRPDMKHLFTGRSLEGMTIGIAYIGTTCYAGGRYAVGISRSVSPALHPFLAAHEIAHNLSAVHDSEDRSVMNPAITSQNDRFSEKAASSIIGFVSTAASCLESEKLGVADMTIDATDPTVFNARATFFVTSAQRCTVTLLGSADGVDYTKVASRKLSPVRSGNTTVRFSAPMPPLTTAQSFSFYSQIACPGGRKTTQVTPLQVGTLSASGSSTPKGWLTRLRRALTQ